MLVFYCCEGLLGEREKWQYGQLREDGRISMYSRSILWHSFSCDVHWLCDNDDERGWLFFYYLALVSTVLLRTEHTGGGGDLFVDDGLLYYIYIIHVYDV